MESCRKLPFVILEDLVEALFDQTLIKDSINQRKCFADVSYGPLHPQIRMFYSLSSHAIGFSSNSKAKMNVLDWSCWI
jgi:hypothetical protein